MWLESQEFVQRKVSNSRSCPNLHRCMRRRKLPGNKRLDFVLEKQSTRHLTHPRNNLVIFVSRPARHGRSLRCHVIGPRVGPKKSAPRHHRPLCGAPALPRCLGHLSGSCNGPTVGILAPEVEKTPTAAEPQFPCFTDVVFSAKTPHVH